MIGNKNKPDKPDKPDNPGPGRNRIVSSDTSDEHTSDELVENL